MVLLERRKVASCSSQGLVLGAINMFLGIIGARIRRALITFLGNPSLGGLNTSKKDSSL